MSIEQRADDVVPIAQAAEGPPVAGRLRVFYFLQFVSVGIYYPFFTPYLRGLGFTGAEIGTAQMASAIASIPAAILWGALADRMGARTRALKLATAGAFGVAVLLAIVKTPFTVTLVMLLHGSVLQAIGPLLDAVAVESIRERDVSYARIRLFGSLGFVAAAQAFGWLLAMRGDRPGDLAVPIGYAAALLCSASAARVLPAVGSSAGPKPRLDDVRALFGDRRLGLLLAAGAVHAGTTACYQLFGVLVRDERLSATVTGAGMAFGVSAEVLVLFAFPVLERRFSVGSLLILSFAGSAVRWLLLSQSHGAFWLVAIQGLHGLTFGLYWGAAVRTLEHLVPSRLRATGQALYHAITFAIGGAVGYRVAGFGYDRFGGAGPVYAWASLVELVPLGLALTLRSPRRRA